MDNLLKQILGELKGLRQGQDELRQAQQKTDDKLTKLALHVEGELTDKISALYDARSLMLEGLARIEQRQDRQDERLDQHWHEILVLKNKCR